MGSSACSPADLRLRAIKFKSLCQFLRFTPGHQGERFLLQCTALPDSRILPPLTWIFQLVLSSHNSQLLSNTAEHPGTQAGQIQTFWHVVVPYSQGSRMLDLKQKIPCQEGAQWLLFKSHGATNLGSSSRLACRTRGITISLKNRMEFETLWRLWACLFLPLLLRLPFSQISASYLPTGEPYCLSCIWNGHFCTSLYFPSLF